MNFDYLKEIKSLIHEIEQNEMQHMEECTQLLADAVMNKNSIYIFGASHAGILSQEMYYRAGGLMLINPIFGREVLLDISPITHTSKMERLVGYGTSIAETVDFKKDDVLLVHSVSGRNPVTIEIAKYAKEKGCKVIGITNLSYSKSVTSRHPSGKNMYEYCDVVLDNHGELGDACVSIEGLQQKVSPTSTVIGSIMLNTIVAAVTQELVHRGMKHPPIFYSANVDGGDELNQKLYEEYKDSIHYKF